MTDAVTQAPTPPPSAWLSLDGWAVAAALLLAALAAANVLPPIAW
jgi:hypothetical protein